MIGHNDETQAPGLELDQLLIQNSQQNSFELIVIEQTTTVVARERNKVNIQGIVDAAQLVHGESFRHEVGRRQASCSCVTQTPKAASGPPRRRLFTQRVKNAQIAEWERQTGQVWPRYAQDLVNVDGTILRRAGDPFDAHHVIENIYGGPHEWWNLTPARFLDQHQGGLHLEAIMDTLFP